MISVIIYVDDPELIQQTIKGVLLATPSALLTEILLCDDTGVLSYDAGDPSVRVVVSDVPVGRAVARNRAAAVATGDVLVFLHQRSRPGDDWVVPLLEAVREDPHVVVGPVLTGLDTNLWAAEPGESLKWAWRWDLSLRRCYDDGSDVAVCLSNNCLAVSRRWFLELGGFDEVPAGPEQQEFCLRVWLCGGKVAVARRSRVAVDAVAVSQDVVGLVRLAEAWFGNMRDRFYRARGLQDGKEQFGNLGQLSRTRDALQVKDIHWFVDRFMPELGKIYDYRGLHAGKSVAVVCDGPSLDYVNKWMVLRHDVVIGVDYVATLFPCNYVVSLQREAVRSLLAGGRYQQERFVLPSVLLGADGRAQLLARELVPGAVTYELAEPGVRPATLEPPFANFGHPVLTALQLAGYLGAREVVLYGWDGRVVDGRSHTALVDHYNGGRYWEEGDATSRRFEYYSAGLEHLRHLLQLRDIPVLKVSHA